MGMSSVCYLVCHLVLPQLATLKEFLFGTNQFLILRSTPVRQE